MPETSQTKQSSLSKNVATRDTVGTARVDTQYPKQNISRCFLFGGQTMSYRSHQYAGLLFFSK